MKKAWRTKFYCDVCVRKLFSHSSQLPWLPAAIIPVFDLPKSFYCFEFHSIFVLCMWRKTTVNIAVAVANSLLVRGTLLFPMRLYFFYWCREVYRRKLDFWSILFNAKRGSLDMPEPKNLGLSFGIKGELSPIRAVGFSVHFIVHLMNENRFTYAILSPLVFNVKAEIA